MTVSYFYVFYGDVFFLTSVDLCFFFYVNVLLFFFKKNPVVVFFVSLLGSYMKFFRSPDSRCRPCFIISAPALNKPLWNVLLKEVLIKTCIVQESRARLFDFFGDLSANIFLSYSYFTSLQSPIMLCWTAFYFAVVLFRTRSYMKLIMIL